MLFLKILFIHGAAVQPPTYFILLHLRSLLKTYTVCTTGTRVIHQNLLPVQHNTRSQITDGLLTDKDSPACS